MRQGARRGCALATWRRGGRLPGGIICPPTLPWLPSPARACRSSRVLLARLHGEVVAAKVRGAALQMVWGPLSCALPCSAGPAGPGMLQPCNAVHELVLGEAWTAARRLRHSGPPKSRALPHPTPQVIDVGRSLEQQQTFLTEASRLHALRHPHIISMFGLTVRWAGCQGAVTGCSCRAPQSAAGHAASTHAHPRARSPPAPRLPPSRTDHARQGRAAGGALL